MANVTYDGQSFMVDGRRIWMLAASIEYARVAPEDWAERIAAVRQAGFNTVATSCPWLVHEPRKGRFLFHGPTDVRHFIELCGQAGLWVILRPGPFVGGGYDAGGLPAWLLETPDVKLREANEVLLERVGLYFRKLMGEVADLQITHGGPILLVQTEHAWLCSNEKQADTYLREVTRYLRENGVNVPLINANDLWQETAGTIDTWRGWEDLLVHLRQLRVVQPDAPRIVSQFNPAVTQTWGMKDADPRRPHDVLQWLAQVLAAGAQPVVLPFHGGTNFGFLGGRLAGASDRFVTTRAAAGTPLTESGKRGPAYIALRRLMVFAGQFSHVFADLEPGYHPVTLDLGETSSPGGGHGQRRASVVHLRGRAGQIVFVFSDGRKQQTTLLLENGIRMPVTLGSQPVSWYVLDVDLRGAGRLDYANLCPHAIVGRGLVVLFGPARAPAFLSIDGSPLEANVPAGGKPLVLQHKRVTVVICDEQQIDETYYDDTTVYVGCSGFDADGTARAGKKLNATWSVKAGGEAEKLTLEAPARGGGSPVKLDQWQAAPADGYAAGTSPRFASLDGPQTLTACGAAHGYGWYRLELKSNSARKRRLHAPRIADRAHLYLDGELLRVIGVGRGAEHAPFDQALKKGPQVLVALLDNLGRFAEGNDLGEPKGLFGHVYEVKRLGNVRPKIEEADAVDPFQLRGYIAGRTFGQRSDTEQVVWRFSHTRKAPILVDVDGAASSGTVVLNDKVMAYYAGASGGCRLRLLLEPAEQEAFRRGRNVLRFAPDLRQPDAAAEVAEATTLYECVESITANASWAFAKWEPPIPAAFRPVTRTAARSLRGTPCWWRTSFQGREDGGPARFDTSGLSKGQVFVNGESLGRYFTAAVDGRPVGPQTKLHVPGSWIKPGEPNELMVFDEHGFAPHRTKLSAMA